jgi:hypothetical protein
MNLHKDTEPYKIVGEPFEMKHCGGTWVKIEGNGWWANVPESEAPWCGNMNEAFQEGIKLRAVKDGWKEWLKPTVLVFIFASGIYIGLTLHAL